VPNKLLLPLVLSLPLLLPPCAHGAVDDARQLVEASAAQVKVDPERSRLLAEQALKLLQATPDADLQVRAHMLLCDFESERDRAAADEHVTQGRALLPKVKRRALGAGLASCEGELYEGAGDNTRAQALYEEAVAIAEATQDDEMLADALYRRGHLRGLRGEFAAGLQDLKQSRGLYERLQWPSHTLTLDNAIAILYNRMGDHAQARHYYEVAVKAQEAAGLRREQAVTQYNLGRSLESMGDWDAAQRAFDSVHRISRELGYHRGIAYSLRGLASVQNARGAPQVALGLLDQAAAQQERVPDARLYAQILLQRGIALRMLRRFGDSAVALDGALTVFRGADARAELAATHGALAATLADQGDWRGAYEQQLQFKAVSDQLLGNQIDERFATLKLELDTAARDREMALLQQAQKATEYSLAQERIAGRLLTLAIMLAAVLLAVLGFLAWRHRRTSVAMRGLAMTDELTGLPNRRAALAEMEAQLGRARPRCALLLADIDLFKAVNDTYGHLAGDHILRAIGEGVRRIEADLGQHKGACLARFGGEEFVAVLPGMGLDEATAIAERWRAQVAALDVSRWTPDRGTSISIGVTLMGEGDTMSTLLRRADEALYAAKAGGRNRVVSRPAPQDAVGGAAPDAPPSAAVLAPDA
jgi:diguanylate cyclase (GGDEF)-like protein